jgi:uncharacterized protein (DUF58 family)
MRLTRRGYGAVGVVLVAIAMALLGGTDGRALNALAAPVLVALVAAAVQVRRAGPPTVERNEPRRGFPGERRTVNVAVDCGGVVTVTDALSSGLAGESTGSGDPPAEFEYEVRLRERGDQTIGPATVRIRDVLGLVEATHETDATSDLLVYPAVARVDGDSLFSRTMGPEIDERTEFDRIREYVPGDRLRDVNWKSTAKRDELLVTEFTDPVDEDAVSIVAGAADGHADAMASATASLVVAALRTGLAVDLTVPDGHLPRGYGQTHRMHALELLARADAGEFDLSLDLTHDVRVWADEDGVSVTIGEQRRSIEDLTVTQHNPLTPGEGIA